jgi:RNA polymerase sigma-70 factor (ECF subfamily)
VADALEADWVTPAWKLAVAGARPESPVVVSDTASDAELVRAALQGSGAAFDLIVIRHRRRVYQLCYRYVGSHEDANDLAQDVFLRAYRGLEHFKGQASFTTWLYRIAVNVALNRVTAKAPRLDRMAPLDGVDRPDPHAEDPAAALLREERARRVRRAIAQLPPKQRATLVLRVYQELSHEEIAAVVGSSVGACKANLFHALNKLRTLLKP